MFISHFLDDILRVSDRVTIFRNGRRIETAAVAEIDKGWIIERMIGTGHQELEESYLGEIRLDSPEDAAVVLETREISGAGFSVPSSDRASAFERLLLWLPGTSDSNRFVEQIVITTVPLMVSLSRCRCRPRITQNEEASC